ncbi:uncharacterized protein EI97DRAFT_461557 [Westerdykella ornata]|uniref:GAR domain-containing protein n=1 Tax=Westerdykella ornata TaxID=318751 RepID=A0A6A6J9D1_WESOR|nr:uncharacterized protein EI97DRAFT_461557 [Westerdykella ornata]KAF2272945.1 hypothetical protein EI97DRAFT_461557 [Westerdykella ornata]
MPPIGRRGRPTASSEESRLRDLSPSDTLRAFTEQPMPFDTSLEEYSVFRCIDSLTPAEKNLGARVAKAAQRLQSWCQEIEQWRWTGSFEPPSEEILDKRRKEIEDCVREHVQGPMDVDSMGRLEYLGSLLAVEVEAHEARLDEISEELQTLEYDDLKEHLRDIYGPNRSRPPSAGYGAGQSRYVPLDDFSMLITQTLVASLPHYVQLQERLNTWTARLTILREVPRYVNGLQTIQKAMALGWDALQPPKDTSDRAFAKWEEAVNTIYGVLQDKISDLGRCLDGMLDALEGRDDCLPDKWIDDFESVEGDFKRWVAESRKRLIEFDLLRKTEQGVQVLTLRGGAGSDTESPHPAPVVPAVSLQTGIDSEDGCSTENTPQATNMDSRPRAVTAIKVGDLHSSSNPNPSPTEAAKEDMSHEADTVTTDSEYEEGDTVVHHEIEDVEGSFCGDPELIDPHDSKSPLVVTVQDSDDIHHLIHRPTTPRSRRNSNVSVTSGFSLSSSPRSLIEDSPSTRGANNRRAKAPRPQLNAAIGKRRPLKIMDDSALDDIPPWPPTQFSQQISPNGSTEELDRKISDILTTIPGNIRLTSQSTRDEARSTRGKLSSKPSRGYLRSTRSMNTLRNPPITLSAAKSSNPETGANGSTGRRSAASVRPDNDIKLYHLTHPGKEKPLKLFIRRVGENGERVMVRVGGGWADLGEYLRQYIEHHGRRTISEGRFEIHGLEGKKVLDKENQGEKADTTPGRPQSAMSSVKRDRRFSGGSTSTTTPKRVPLAPRAATSLSNTPGSAVLPEDEVTATPSTDASLRSWRGDEVGLAGPKAKKLDLSGEKLEWLEGMMKQARSVSSGNLLPPGGKPEGVGREGVSSRSESRNENRNGRPRTAGAGAAGPTAPAFADLGKFITKEEARKMAEAHPEWNRWILIPANEKDSMLARINVRLMSEGIPPVEMIILKWRVSQLLRDIQRKYTEGSIGGLLMGAGGPPHSPTHTPTHPEAGRSMQQSTQNQRSGYSPSDTRPYDPIRDV